jgi:hypothetical protein
MNYYTNYGAAASLIGSDLAYKVGTQNRRGFDVSWVGKENNDKLSSFKIDSYNALLGKTSAATFSQLSSNLGFNLVLFEHANFKGKAISFYIDMCNPRREVNRLTIYLFTGWFATWNDKVSSYYGYDCKR